VKRLLGAAILTGALVACGDRFAQPEGPAGISRATPTATATLPNDPPKIDPTYAPVFPPIFRVRWIYIADRTTLQLQEDGNPGLLKEARLRAADGRLIASGTAHLAIQGEPRQCISAVVSPPLVAALAVGPDIADALRTGTPAYSLEVRDDSSWYEVELIDWSKLAEGYCVQ
jgi:hypothetical protein